MTIPALLVFPTLFLFIFLIYETAKISREKIRHQFAMDAAAFVEMTNYSDFLNRTAYVNGAFPMRIFYEGFSDLVDDCNGKASKANCNPNTKYAYILWKNGAFPYIGGYRQEGDPNGMPDPTSQSSWKIEYGGAGAYKTGVTDSSQIKEPFELFTEDDAEQYWHKFDLANEIYKLYIQIYTLLGQVEYAQLDVLKKLSAGHQFLKKSYWLNTGEKDQTLATSFENQLGSFMSSVRPICQHKMLFWGNKPFTCGGGDPYNNLEPAKPCKTDEINLTQSPYSNQICQEYDGNGLFQFEYLDQGMLNTLTKDGLKLNMDWMDPSVQNVNFFNIPFKDLIDHGYAGRELHTTISLKGDPNNFPSVWPDPTPLFQVRQEP